MVLVCGCDLRAIVAGIFISMSPAISVYVAIGYVLNRIIVRPTASNTIIM